MTNLDPSAYAASAPASTGASEPAEPIGELIARWRSIVAAYGDPYLDHTDEETDAFTDKTHDMVEQIGKRPAADMRDLAAKGEVARHGISDEIAGGPIGPFDALVLSLLDDIQRLAGNPAVEFTRLRRASPPGRDLAAEVLGAEGRP